MSAQTLRMCAAPACERPARKRPWCTPDWRRVPPELRTAYARAVGRRDRGVEEAVAEAESAREAITAWLIEHPGVSA